MQFQVRIFDVVSGLIDQRMVEGASATEVRQLLEHQGNTVLSISEQGARGLRMINRSPSFNVTLFADELRTLLISGMTLVEAIETLTGRDSQGTRHDVLAEIQQHLLEGKPLSEALHRNRFPFPPLLLASIRASERTSRLAEALAEYADYERIGADLRKKIISAAIYPSLVTGFGFLVSLFMIAYVVPRFGKVYEDFSQSISLATLTLLKVGQFASDYLVFIMIALALGVGGIIVTYRNGRLKVFLLRVLGRIRIVQFYLRQYQLTRIYQTVSMLLRGGYTLTEAIPLAQELAFDATLHQQIDIARNLVMEGKRLSSAFGDSGLTDHVSGRLLQVGERSGNLAVVLDTIASNYRQEFMLFVDRATRIAEPLLLMVVGMMIGAIIILMYMPVFDLAGGI